MNMKFRSFILKVLRLTEFLMLTSSLFHFDIAERKNEFLNIFMPYFYLFISFSLEFYTVFRLYIQAEGYRNILKLKCSPLAFSSY